MKHDYYISATEWLGKQDELSRTIYHPKKPTLKELKEWHKTMSEWEYRSALKRITQARDNIKRDQMTYDQRIRYIAGKLGKDPSVFAQMSKPDIKTAYKQASKNETKGHIEDLYWYLNVLKSVGIDDDLIQRLYDLQKKLSPSELDMLYNELPDLTLYYQATKPNSKSQYVPEDSMAEWEEQLDDVMSYYEDNLTDSDEEE